MLKYIILTQYRSHRSFASILTGRKAHKPDLQHSRPASASSASKLTRDKSNDQLSSSLHKSGDSEESKVLVAGDPHVFYLGSDHSSHSHCGEQGEAILNRNFQLKLENLKHHYVSADADDSTLQVESFLMMTGEVDFLQRTVIAFVRLKVCLWSLAWPPNEPNEFIWWKKLSGIFRSNSFGSFCGNKVFHLVH